MTETADPRVIEIDQFYPHPPQRVWQTLTTPELMARWLMEPSGFAPVVGTRFSFRGPHRMCACRNSSTAASIPAAVWLGCRCAPRFRSSNPSNPSAR